MKNLFDIKNKVIVITGGCFILGKNIDKYMAEKGAIIVIMEIVEVAGGAANDMEKKAKANKGKHKLRIIEIEFLESIKE